MRTRAWWGLPVAIAIYASLLACTINIDHSLIKDGPRDQPATDLASDAPASDADGPRAGDQRRGDTRRIIDRRLWDLLKCTPSAVLGCTGDHKYVVRCSSTGYGTTNVSCQSYTCDEALKRCTGCVPGQPATCSGSNRVTCSSLGLPQSSPCPLGCQGGACCTDPDGDGYSVCTGDCNEGDPDVHPKQTQYFSTASGGKFDYDCDGQDEQQYPGLVNCQAQSTSNCSLGDGWQGSVPPCGTSGSFVACKKQATCVMEEPTTKVQACQ